MSTKVQKVMVQPITVIFKHFQAKQRVAVWLFDNDWMRLEGIIAGFDEFMNLVMDDAEEVHYKKNTRTVVRRKKLGRTLLKGDCISLIQAVTTPAPPAEQEDEPMA
ncbi:hypothetical protein H9P43_008867 [Blastocladiella emersonii ATCC 22665]|nr:hypothetical protein H9P43_008867 [Blastocladiella emersonii ATCC 22665]